MADSLKERLQADLKTAMRDKDNERRDTIRLLISELKKKEIDDRRELDQAGEIQLLQTQAKQRRDSIEQFEAGDRQDLARKEQIQLEIIESYLPQQMTDAELAAFIDAGIAEAGASGTKDMGKVMGLLSRTTEGRVDGRRLAENVRNRLTTLGR